VNLQLFFSPLYHSRLFGDHINVMLHQENPLYGQNVQRASEADSAKDPSVSRYFNKNRLFIPPRYS